MDRFPYNRPACVGQTGENVLPLEERVFLKQPLSRLSRREHSQDMFNSQPHPANERFPTDNRRIRRDSRQQVLFRHADSFAWIEARVG